MLKKIVITLSILLWPLNIFLNFNKLHFHTETVFKNDYQGEQLVLRNIHLYPFPLFARVFQNKPRIYIDKYLNNLFVLTDPNSYFFATHPEPVPGNLNLSKYPFFAIIFFVIGIFNIAKSKYKKIIIVTFIGGVIILSALTNFEGFDFILWIPISLLIINGITVLQVRNKNLFAELSLIFILFTIPEILRSFFNK